MADKQTVISKILSGKYQPAKAVVDVFAPANIALCKYWGKRNLELNLPVTDSLSLSLGTLGSHCKLSDTDKATDRIVLNGNELSAEHPFVKRLVTFLDLFREHPSERFCIETTNTIPTAAGFASSASGFAAVVKALDRRYGWQLPAAQLSILARMGSGSASRSLWQGFVRWHAGQSDDGMDSVSEPLESQWEEICIGLLVLNRNQKKIGSTEAMKRTVETSALYRAWPQQVERDMTCMLSAIEQRDFEMLGKTAETNALAMHATMMAACPPVLYWQPESLIAMQTVWQARNEGLPVYFTMDAGPNIKLVFQKADQDAIEKRFEGLVTANPWEDD
jgi:diphosphomevalonate decarboxylase